MTQEHSLSALQAHHDKELSEATQRHALMTSVIKALDESGAAPTGIHDFGYCADVSLQFQFSEGILPALLKSYPPEPLVLVRDGSLAQKPVSYLRDNEPNASLVPLAPVLFKASKGSDADVVWWTKLNSGHVAQVQLRRAQRAAFDQEVCAPRFSQDSHTYATGFTAFGVRGLAPVETVVPALKRWHDAWGEFAKERGYNGAQRSYLNGIRSNIVSPVKDRDWVEQGFPDSVPVLAGNAIVIPEGRNPAEVVQELQANARNRKPHWMDRIGDFWAHFTLNTAEELWKFCLHMNDRWSAAVNADAAEAESVRQAFEKLFEKGYPSEAPYIREYLLHAVAQMTGLQPTFRIATQRRDGHIEMEVRLSSSFVDRADHRLTLRANPAQALRPQDIPVTYVV